MRWIRSVFLPGVVMLLALVPHARAAQGSNLSWSHCHGEGTSAQNREFACDTNAGGEVLVASFVLDGPLTQVTGNEVQIDLISQSDPLPAWWDMKDVGTCRQAALGFNTVANASDAVCVDWAQAQSAGGIGAYNANGTVPTGPLDPAIYAQHRQLLIALAVPLSGIQDLVANTEYFSCNIPISHIKTVGAGSCAGCTTPVCIVLTRLKVTTLTGSSDVSMLYGTTPGSNIVTWQGTGADCNAVPVKNRTWGEVKAMYR